MRKLDKKEINVTNGGKRDIYRVSDQSGIRYISIDKNPSAETMAGDAVMSTMSHFGSKAAQNYRDGSYGWMAANGIACVGTGVVSFAAGMAIALAKGIAEAGASAGNNQ